MPTAGSVLWVRLQLIFFDRGKKQAQEIVDSQAAAQKASQDVEAAEQRKPATGQDGQDQEVRMDLIFDVDMSAIADDKQGFKTTVIREIADSLGGRADKIRVLSLQPYAVTHLDSAMNRVRLVLALDADVSDQFCDASDVVNELKRRTANPDSRLMQGVLAHVREAHGGVAEKPAAPGDAVHASMLSVHDEGNPDSVREHYCVLKDGEVKCYRVEDLVVTDKQYDLEASVPVESFSCNGT